MTGPDALIHQLAEPQHGVFSRSQARRAGITRQAISTRVRRGDLVAVNGEILVLRGSAATDHRDAIAAVLSGRAIAALSHASCAGFWHLPGCTMRPFEVTVVRPSRTSPHDLCRMHTTTHLPDAHLTYVDGLWVTVPVRVIFDLAGRLHPERTARLIDAAWRMRLVTGRLLARTLAELAERGRPGIQVMRRLIEERGDNYRPPESNTEARFQQLVREIGIDSFERQVDLGGIDWAGRVDFIDRELRLIVEIDSDTFHLSLTDRADDQARRQALEAAGFIVLSVRDVDVWSNPRKVQQIVRDARRRARTRLTTTRS